jgi:hypothetical protein
MKKLAMALLVIGSISGCEPVEEDSAVPVPVPEPVVEDSAVPVVVSLTSVEIRDGNGIQLDVDVSQVSNTLTLK